MKNSKRPPIVKFAILTVIMTLSWVFFSVYSSFTKKPDEPVPEEILNPLNSRLDQNTLSKLRQRFYVDEENIQDTQIIPSTGRPSTTPTPNPTSTPILETTPTVSPTASP